MGKNAEAWRHINTIDIDRWLQDCQNQDSVDVIPIVGRDGQGAYAIVCCPLTVAMALLEWCHHNGMENKKLPGDTLPLRPSILN